MAMSVLDRRQITSEMRRRLSLVSGGVRIGKTRGAGGSSSSRTRTVTELGVATGLVKDFTSYAS
jgi:hypothetical protein